ncbi:PTS sugar transporter subunit IIC [Enterococcus sp.]|uniref:PTS sugar transporter subunit IIC n=1 Tax=Enterococcus sp. TaxID=35783 RepID=UPI002915A68C|nr:PTS transporter subunit EIIC [Enterococcus sp.]MDU5335676.1 PTS transporter subunit EIIC [Enterococcus sp.]
MNFMEKFNQVAERSLLPIANKLSRQRHLTALRNGMVSAIPLSIMGGASLIIATPPFNPEQMKSTGFFTGLLSAWYDWAQANAAALKLPFMLSMGLMGLFIAFSIAHNLAEEYGLPALDVSIVSTVTFLIVSAPSHIGVPLDKLSEKITAEEFGGLGVLSLPMQYLDAKGIFTAIIVSITCVEIMRILTEKDIRFKMPDGVPPAIAASFDAILPLFLCVGLFYGISLGVQNITQGQLIPEIIMQLLAPAMNGLDSLFGICLITFLAQLFWFFGLHGASITQFVRLPFMSAYIVANATAFSSGEPLKHFFTQPFWSYIIAIGGGGSTLALAILMIFARSQQMRKLGRISIIPSIFNINEPLIFGTPLVLNPIMMLPFIFVPVINAIFGYAFMYFGWIGKGIIETPWTTPAPIGAALGTMDYRAGLFVLVLIVVNVLIYYPFFRVLDHQKVREEKKVEMEEEQVQLQTEQV